jgi:hypothetical protein
MVRFVELTSLQEIGVVGQPIETQSTLRPDWNAARMAPSAAESAAAWADLRT